MTTFEEDLVDVYYNLNDYFTMRNISFSSDGKQKGGKGREEIDILAVHVKDSKFMNCSHIEVSVSVTDKFPHPNSSETIIKKFFSNSSEKKIKEIIGNCDYSNIMITSDFGKNAKEWLHLRWRTIWSYYFWKIHHNRRWNPRRIANLEYDEAGKKISARISAVYGIISSNSAKR